MIENLRKWLLRKWLLSKLIRRYRREIIGDKILEEWITACIVERKHEGRRKELQENRAKQLESELFVKWLETQK